ncbi:integrase [Microbacterium sp. Gd 4-13]|uniref:tyrosine-type recombinase/integrase n=1 Tax=Microbacterium sp. Gd 4-13 TaxID=2173179 RepID=UPI000D57CF0C|nr:tyrosine-type recombinase/integrase [Microbacterium sp. Gd 4-13]PVW01896.1 integrase [Microbacterium sp. Gd 4-13]
MTITFSSGFATHIEAMLQWRTALGYSRRTLAYPMLSFDRYCVAHPPSELILTRELVTAWCREGTRIEWPAYRAHAIREFGRYLQLVGVEAFVLPAQWIRPPSRSLPHIFSDSELVAFFAAADSVTPSGTSPFREYTIPVLFRLMLGCGLRPQEARLLRRRNVDLGGAIVTIEQSKRNKDRRVPVDTGMADLLAGFDELADLCRPGREFFFEDHPGQPYPARWVTAHYHRCRERAGGVAAGSTPYTLRHNYATRTLTRWVEEGRDLTVWLPYLSAYMGHDTYAATAYYIHLLPERLAATGLTGAAGIIPEVTS